MLNVEKVVNFKLVDGEHVQRVIAIVGTSQFLRI